MVLGVYLLGWVAISFSRGSFRTRDQTWVSCIASRLYNLSSQGSPFTYYKSVKMCMEKTLANLRTLIIIGREGLSNLQIKMTKCYSREWVLGKNFIFSVIFCVSKISYN